MSEVPVETIVTELKAALEPFATAYARRIAHSGPWNPLRDLTSAEFERAYEIWLKY